MDSDLISDKLYEIQNPEKTTQKAPIVDTGLVALLAGLNHRSKEFGDV